MTEPPDRTANVGPLDFTPTRQAGLARMEQGAARFGRHYREHRNHDLGPDDRTNVSVLSPWITHRLVSERDVVARATSDHGKGTPEKFVQEVFWRTYWKGWLEMRPHIWRAYEGRVARALDAAEGNGGIRRDLNAAMEGRTGIEGFDDWATEIARTGYLHNHARMWFASIWIHTLRLDWALGADFFLRHLMDGDPASNTLSWRWVAGLQTRGKAYAATQSNIARFTNGRFNPRGLNENPAPLSEDEDLSPDPIDPPSPLPGGRALLLVHAADCSPEQLRWPGTEIVGVAGFADPHRRSPLETSDLVARFARGAVEDGTARAAAHWSCEGSMAGDDAEAVVAMAKEAGADHIVLPTAPVGDVRDRLDRVSHLAREAGLGWHENRRDWDARAWPHATKGYFKFKERIPQLMRDAGL